LKVPQPERRNAAASIAAGMFERKILRITFSFRQFACGDKESDLHRNGARLCFVNLVRGAVQSSPCHLNQRFQIKQKPEEDVP